MPKSQTRYNLVNAHCDLFLLGSLLTVQIHIQQSHTSLFQSHCFSVQKSRQQPPTKNFLQADSQQGFTSQLKAQLSATSL